MFSQLYRICSCKYLAISVAYHHLLICISIRYCFILSWYSSLWSHNLDQPTFILLFPLFDKVPCSSVHDTLLHTRLLQFYHLKCRKWISATDKCRKWMVCGSFPLFCLGLHFRSISLWLYAVDMDQWTHACLCLGWLLILNFCLLAFSPWWLCLMVMYYLPQHLTVFLIQAVLITSPSCKLSCFGTGKSSWNVDISMQVSTAHRYWPILSCY